MLYQPIDMVSPRVQDQIALERMQRRLRLQRAWDRYHGKFPDALLPTKADPKGDDNVKLSLCGLIVDISTFFLFGKPIQFEVENSTTSRKRRQQKDAGEADADAAETWLQDCWAANRQATTLLDLGTNGGVTGDAFLKLKRPPPGEEFPRLIVLDPENVTPIWAADDYEDICEYRLEWTGTNPDNGKPVAFRQTITKNASGMSWRMVDEKSEGDNARWSETGRETWPYAFAPIFHAKNRPNPNAYYGTADLEDDVMDANEDLNFVLSSIKRVLRYHGHPKTWARGIAATDLDMSIANIAVINSENGTLQNLEMQSDLSSSREFAKDLKAAFHEIASIPEVAAGKVENIGQLSGLALKILYGPLTRLTAVKQLYYGEMLSELGQCLLQMRTTGCKSKVSIQWPDPLPKDEIAEAQAAVEKQVAGVSKDTSLSEMGYDPETEAKKRADEAQAAQQFGDKLLQQFETGGLGAGALGGQGAGALGGDNGNQGPSDTQG